MAKEPRGRPVSMYLPTLENRMLEALVDKAGAARGEGESASRSEVVQDAIRAKFDREFPEFAERRNKSYQEAFSSYFDGGLPQSPDQLAGFLDYGLQVALTETLAFLDELEAAKPAGVE